MASEIKSLWEVQYKRDTKTPLAVLNEQANFIGPATGGVVKGKVETLPNDNNLIHRLILFAENVKTKFSILSVIHELDKPYPAVIQSEDLSEKVKDKSSVVGLEIERKVYPEAFNEESFYSFLRRAINGKSAQAAISSLLSLSHEASIGNPI